MRLKIYFPGLCVAIACFLAVIGCENKNTVHTEFTKADSLTETYLALQDSMLQVWNTMIHDDNRKIKAMHHLRHELSMSRPEKREELEHYKERLDDLLELRYDQQSMSDAELVSEYDFASNSLVSELIALAESQKEFAYNPTLQKLVDSIRAADQRVNNYRQEYDDIALRFNRFVEHHLNTLEEIEKDSTIQKKPLFQMAAE
jgi:septal ring factor EnvC (AmiA/AmiB activator)